MRGRGSHTVFVSRPTRLILPSAISTKGQRLEYTRFLLVASGSLPVLSSFLFTCRIRVLFDTSPIYNNQIMKSNFDPNRMDYYNQNS